VNLFSIALEKGGTFIYLPFPFPLPFRTVTHHPNPPVHAGSEVAQSASESNQTIHYRKWIDLSDNKKMRKGSRETRN
jgi:hypothetical protein